MYISISDSDVGLEFVEWCESWNWNVKGSSVDVIYSLTEREGTCNYKIEE